ncbi:MAG: nuclear transport factor 2 family protein [Segetibacter sp.]|jgi:hypothetical protein|nr:nuclear transport factor 2 family protein [Segetibacter sp.]
MKKLVIVLLTSFVALVAFSQSAEEVKVWARADALRKAVFETKDVTSLNDLVGSKVSYGHSTGLIEDKPTMIQNAVTSKTTYRNGSVEKSSIAFIDKTAIVREIFRATSVDEKGVESPLNIGIMQVWIKDHGKWKLFGRQAVKVNPK